jgi:hypothetical protein
MNTNPKAARELLSDARIATSEQVVQNEFLQDVTAEVEHLQEVSLNKVQPRPKPRGE